MRTEEPTIFLIGLGHLGGVLLEFLARESWIGEIVACSRRPQRGEARCNVARLGAIAQGFAPRITYRQLDVFDPQSVTEALHAASPDVVVSTATLQTWWLPNLLPGRARERLQAARFGPWLPLHLAPTLALMQAIADSSFGGPVLTAPFPDVVNCILGKLRLAPTCGIGNIDELVAKVRWSAAQRLDADINTIEAQMVAHHALEAAVLGEGKADRPPFFLRLEHQGVEITDSRLVEEILFSPSPLPEGPETAFFTTGSTSRLGQNLLADDETLIHVPAPHGLPGGYPVTAGKRQVTLAAVDGLGLSEAIEINERSHPFDGVAAIEDDGTTVFTPESVEVMRTELSYDCPSLPPAEALERGRELRIRFAEYAARHGVDLSRIF